jgi:hypothetical protein
MELIYFPGDSQKNSVKCRKCEICKLIAYLHFNYQLECLENRPVYYQDIYEHF